METPKELVSIIIRTCNRPHILKEALESVRKQTYRPIEVVVVEDGQNTAQKMITEEFSDLDIQYACTGEKKGRTYVGNLALSMSKGRYLNFLDDDDMLFPEHVETLVQTLTDSTVKAAYTIAYESVVKYDPDKKVYKEYKRRVRYKQPFNRLYLTIVNYIPIQSIMFERCLYEELGGFDEELDVLEDWDVWLRYTTKTDYKFVDKITSLYRVPLKNNKRDNEFIQAYESVIEKFKTYEKTDNYLDTNKELNYILEEIKTPKWKKHLKQIRNYFLYGRH